MKILSKTANVKSIKIFIRGKDSKNKCEVFVLPKIHILLSNFLDTGSKVITALTGCSYPHASVGFDDDINTFYSFVSRGFIVEKISRYIKPGRAPYSCQLYTLEVSEKVYLRIKELISYFVKYKPYLGYSRLGMVLSLVGIPYKPSPLKYFCSQFVAEVLERAGAVRLKKKSRKYFSNDLKALPGMKLSFQGNMKTMLESFGSAPLGNI